MALTGKPAEATYNPPNTVYAMENNAIITLTVAGVDVIVSDPLDDETGIQTNMYSFVERPDLRLSEDRLYVSTVALKAAL